MMSWCACECDNTSARPRRDVVSVIEVVKTVLFVVVEINGKFLDAKKSQNIQNCTRLNSQPTTSPRWLVPMYNAACYQPISIPSIAHHNEGSILYAGVGRHFAMSIFNTQSTIKCIYVHASR